MLSYGELVERNVSFFKKLREEIGLSSDIARCYLILELNYCISDVNFIENEYEKQKES